MKWIMPPYKGCKVWQSPNGKNRHANVENIGHAYKAERQVIYRNVNARIRFYTLIRIRTKIGLADSAYSRYAVIMYKAAVDKLSNENRHTCK